MGAAPDVVAQVRAEEETALLFDLHPDNEPIVLLFLALQTQWRVAIGMAGAVWLGLDYSAIPVAMRYCKFQGVDRADLFHGLRVMERAALRVLNAKSETETEDPQDA